MEKHIFFSHRVGLTVNNKMLKQLRTNYLAQLCSNFKLKGLFFRPLASSPCLQKSAFGLRGQGGLHQDFLEIDFLVVSDRGE